MGTSMENFKEISVCICNSYTYIFQNWYFRKSASALYEFTLSNNTLKKFFSFYLTNLIKCIFLGYKPLWGTKGQLQIDIPERVPWEQSSSNFRTNHGIEQFLFLHLGTRQGKPLCLSLLEAKWLSEACVVTHSLKVEKFSQAFPECLIWQTGLPMMTL